MSSARYPANDTASAIRVAFALKTRVFFNASLFADQLVVLASACIPVSRSVPMPTEVDTTTGFSR